MRREGETLRLVGPAAADAQRRDKSGRGLTSREERAAAGKAMRSTVPLDVHAAVHVSDDRDPVTLLERQERSRVPDLVPIRHGRMLVSPFTFYRGAALVMAADLATTPTTGLQVQLCGDAHLSNFGAYASPERQLVFDINDFDETHVGPFEWDVKRLAASLVVAGAENGFSRKDRRQVALCAVQAYRNSMRDFARQSFLDVWYSHLAAEAALAEIKATLRMGKVRATRTDLAQAEALVAKARTRDTTQAISKLTTLVNGERRFVSDPPLLVPLEELTLDMDVDEQYAEIGHLLSEYRSTLRSDRRHLLDHYRLAQIAHKVVGVGSVGTRAWVLLLRGTDPADALLLQAKQAQPSVLAEFVEGRTFENQGERVVTGQYVIQAASDIFLGWLPLPTDRSDPHYYVRQLRDWKLSVDVSLMNPVALANYGRLCGWTLARAHARSGDRIAISAYLGKSERFDNAIADFAETYASQNERDHAALKAAVATGRVQARSGL